MRQAMADYVRALHQAYVDAVQTLPAAERARLPLVSAGQVTVAAAGVRHLHVIGTVEELPAPRGPEVELTDSLDDVAWTLRFFDPVVVPGLGLIDESSGPDHDEVRRALGIRTVVYHLAVPPGSSLTAHHALHAGTGLAHAHAAAARDFAQRVGANAGVKSWPASYHEPVNDLDRDEFISTLVSWVKERLAG